jgi:CBS domain-containing protein
MKNSQAFLDSFAAIEQWLRSLLSANRATSFYQLVDMASRTTRTVARYSDDLKEYADLRNAIVHARSDGRVIAEPNDAAVSDLGRLQSMLLNPPKVLPTFQGKVHTREASQALGEAVAVMLEGSLSQLPVMEKGRVIGLLTSNTIARWLGHEVATDLFSLRETTMAEVLRDTEDPENHGFLGRMSTLFEALARFEDFAAHGKDLDAILLTHHGRSNASLLGILTLEDSPKILKMLGLTRVSAT